jgi:hypothetical protein
LGRQCCAAVRRRQSRGGGIVAKHVRSIIRRIGQFLSSISSIILFLLRSQLSYCRCAIATLRVSSLSVTKRDSSFRRTSISSSFSRLHVNTPHHAQTTHKMFRTALLRSARQAIRVAPRCQTSIARPAARSSLFQSKQITPASYFQAVRCYSASAGLAKEEVQGRIMDLLKNFDKV